MVVFPNAKLNLGLHVVAKRPDGYHELETCFYPLPWHDVLEMVPAQKTKFEQSGIDLNATPKQNLVLRAFELLRKDYNLPPQHFYLHKVLPIGAGLGGGSADAAFTLKMVNEVFNLFVAEDVLEDYAAQLGSDCAFFVRNQAAMATGRGEVLSPTQVSLAGTGVVLVYPNVMVSTQTAYKGVKPQTPALPLQQVLEMPRQEWKQHLVNDFEPSVFEQFPAIAQVKEQLYNMGAWYACMTGSGASVFALFNEAPTLAQVRRAFPANYTCWVGTLQ